MGDANDLLVLRRYKLPFWRHKELGLEIFFQGPLLFLKMVLLLHRMEILLIIILIIMVAGFGLIFYFMSKEKKDEGQDKSLLMLQNQINEITRTLDSRLSDTTKLMHSQFGQSTRIITDVTEKLTKLDETNKQVLNFSDQLRRLQDILKNPKQRGVFGEYYLETLLKNAFTTKQYQMQYKLGRDEKTQKELIADAVLFIGDKKIPIDSKFSLENYNRIIDEHDEAKREQLERAFKQDLKHRIDETSKYIKPAEGTTDFAFMFIPAEGIYYDLLVNQVGAVKVNTRDLIDYAINEKRVHIVSPTTFYVTLQSLFQGMRAYQIQESTKEILKNVIQLGKHLKAYDEYMKKLGQNLGTSVNAYNTAYKELNKIDKDIVKISGGEKAIDPMEIDRPQS